MAHMTEDETVLIARSRQLAEELEQILRSDTRGEITPEVDRAWDISALRKEV
jgi:hypothetical protein